MVGQQNNVPHYSHTQSVSPRRAMVYGAGGRSFFIRSKIIFFSSIIV